MRFHFVFRLPRIPYKVVVIHSKLPNDEEGLTEAISAPCIGQLLSIMQVVRTIKTILHSMSVRTFRGVANRWLEFLEPTKLHIQRIVQKLELNQLVSLVEVNIDSRRTTVSEIYAFGDVWAIARRLREEGDQTARLQP
jgi:hypothetical protein